MNQIHWLHRLLLCLQVPELIQLLDSLGWAKPSTPALDLHKEIHCMGQWWQHSLAVKGHSIPQTLPRRIEFHRSATSKTAPIIYRKIQWSFSGTRSWNHPSRRTSGGRFSGQRSFCYIKPLGGPSYSRTGSINAPGLGAGTGPRPSGYNLTGSW